MDHGTSDLRDEVTQLRLMVEQLMLESHNRSQASGESSNNPGLSGLGEEISRALLAQ